MHVPVNVEFAYPNSGPQTVLAGETKDFSWPTPEGWVGISWGFVAVHPILEFQTAGFSLDENGKQKFVATIRNPGGVDRSIRFAWVLMKV